MIRHTLKITSTLVLLFFISCKATKTYTDYCAPLRTDNILTISIEIQADTLTVYTISDQQEMKDFIADLNNSKVNGPWKGAKWDKIVLKYEDSTKTFSTNGEVFGQGSSGVFYNLNSKYAHYWKK